MEGAVAQVGTGVLPDVRRDIPDLGGEDEGLGVLDDALGPGGDAVAPTAGPEEIEPVVLAVPERIGREVEFPIAVGIEAFEAEIGTLLPATKVTGEEEGSGIGSPFAENPAGGSAVQAVVLVAKGEVFQRDPAIPG